jgi:hypothetical protein
MREEQCPRCELVIAEFDAGDIEAGIVCTRCTPNAAGLLL